MKILLKLLIIIGSFLLCQTFSNVYAKDITAGQVNFIFESGNNLITKPASNSIFTIALIGSKWDTKKLIDDFELSSKTKTIQSRRVKIIHYRKLDEINNEDLIVFSSGMKLKIQELESNLSRLNYIVLTESAPFGITFFNADAVIIQTNQAKLIDENKTNEQLLDSAVSTIDEQKESILNKEQHLLKKDKILNENANTIESQSGLITEKTDTIKFQKWIIIFGTLSLLIISGLLYVLYKVDKQRKLNLKELEVKNKHIMDSLNYAKNIQDAILPNSKFFSSSFKDNFVLFEPKDIVSGDFYWTEEHLGKLYFAVADCTGHGVPGAFLSLVCSSALSKVIKENNVVEPEKILDAVSKELEIFFSKNTKKINDGMDISLICYDQSLNQFTFSGAHNSLIYIKKGELNSVSADKQPIGAYDHKKPFTQKVLNGSDIDSLYLFSDGYPDQFGGPKNKKFSKKRFKQLLLDIEKQPMVEQREILLKNFSSWRGDLEQIDDVTIVGFKVNQK